MTEVLWALVCKHAAFTPEGEIVIQGEFVEANFTSFPVSPPIFYVVARLASDDTQGFRLQSRVVAPSGDVVVFDDGERVEPRHGYILIIRGFEGITLPGPGNYYVDFLVRNKPIHSITLSFVLKRNI